MEGTNDLVFAHTYEVIQKYVETMYEKGTMPEFEVYDVGMINTLAYFRKIGVIKKPIYLQFVMGILGGIPAETENLAFLVSTAKKQLNNEFVWSVAGAGKKQFAMAAAALSMGGNVRVGLEDNLYLRPKVMAKNSGEQVHQVKEMILNMGKEVASPEDARKILDLKGLNKVGY